MKKLKSFAVNDDIDFNTDHKWLWWCVCSVLFIHVIFMWTLKYAWFGSTGYVFFTAILPIKTTYCFSMHCNYNIPFFLFFSIFYRWRTNLKEFMSCFHMILSRWKRRREELFTHLFMAFSRIAFLIPEWVFYEQLLSVAAKVNYFELKDRFVSGWEWPLENIGMV